MAQGKLENFVSSACLKKSILILIFFVIIMKKITSAISFNVEKIQPGIRHQPAKLEYQPVKPETQPVKIEYHPVGSFTENSPT